MFRYLTDRCHEHDPSDIDDENRLTYGPLGTHQSVRLARRFLAYTAGSANSSNKQLPTRARFNMNESDMTSIKLSPGKISHELRLPLIANAIFGIAVGLLLLLAPVGGWLGVDIDGWLRVFGALILGHALMLLALLPKVDTAKLAKLNLSMIAPYPILMIVVVVTGLVSRPLGQGLVLVDGLIVAGIAAWHFQGLKGERSATLPQHA